MARRRSILITLIGRIAFFAGLLACLLGLFIPADSRWTLAGEPVYRTTFRSILIVCGFAIAYGGHLVARRRVFGLALLLTGCAFAVVADMMTVLYGAEAAVWHGFVPAVADVAIMAFAYSRRSEFKATNSVEKLIANTLELGSQNDD